MDETFGSFMLLSPSEADAECQPFLGFFPPSMDGTLVSLINSTKPGHFERESRSEAGLAELRFMGLESLEKYRIEEGDAFAAWIAREGAARGKPFGLYLRNFRLGAEVVPGIDDPHGEKRVLTVMTRDDIRMQSFLLTQSQQSEIPFIAIANRAAGIGILPSLTFSNDDWERGAEILIQHAAVIVLYFLTLTPGVDQEIDLLRAAGAMERTLIVVEDEDPRKITDDFSGLFRNREGKSVDKAIPPAEPETQLEPQTPPADFPYQVRLSTETPDDKVIKEALDSLLQKLEPLPQRELPELPPPYRPTRELLDRARANALKEFDTAQEAMSKGEGIAAEDALLRSIAFSHWSRDPLGRAMAFTMLGNVERLLLKHPNQAVDAYLLGLDLFESLLPFSPTASEAYEPAARQVASYLKELGDPKRAEWVLARLEKNKPSVAATPKP